jgi:hypothetical protein
MDLLKTAEGKVGAPTCFSWECHCACGFDESLG